MSTNKTTHYGLHLWEPEDQFVRTEFNENSVKVDGALWAAARRADAVDYSLFNLLLRDYYEGKYTGWKKALVFDGFLDEKRIAQRSEGLLWDEGRLTLSRPKGQAEEVATAASWTYSTNTAHSSHAVTVVETCFLWRIKFSWRVGNESLGGKLPITFYIQVNDQSRHSEEHMINFTVTPQTDYVVLRNPVRLAAGDSVKYLASHGGEYYQMSIVPGGELQHLYGVLSFRTATALAGRMVSTAAALPAGSGALAWVRHSGGNVGAALRRGETDLPLPKVGRQTAQTAQGAACTETVFALHRPLEGGDWAVALDGALGEDDDMTIWDYGVVVV